MRHLLSGNLEMMSALILYVLSPSSSCFCPSRSKHHRLKSAGAALILLGAGELSMSFSLDSLKGSLSFPLGFHCLLAASSAGQITARYLPFECIWEGSTVVLHRPPAIRSKARSVISSREVAGVRQQGDRGAESMSVHLTSNGIHFLNSCFVMGGGANAALDVLWEELVAAQIILKFSISWAGFTTIHTSCVVSLNALEGD